MRLTRNQIDAEMDKDMDRQDMTDYGAPVESFYGDFGWEADLAQERQDELMDLIMEDQDLMDAKMVDEHEARETSTYVGKYFYCYDF